MYIKKFERYIKENNEEKSKGEILQFQLRDFQNKKGNLKSLVMGNIDNKDKDISKNYTDIVGENPFLNTYGNMLKIQAEIESRLNRYKELGEEANQLKKDRNLLDKLSDEKDKAEQQKSIDEQIKEKGDQGKELQDSIKELQDRIKTMEVGLKEFIEQKTKELQEIKKNVIYPK